MSQQRHRSSFRNDDTNSRASYGRDSHAPPPEHHNRNASDQEPLPASFPESTSAISQADGEA
jgi:hypothetical protein